MPSEYDFLFPYSRGLRRAGSALMAIGAFLAGAVCMAVVIALPLWSVGKDDTGADTASVNTEQAVRKTPVAGSPAEPACEAQTWPHIDRNCPKQKQSEPQRSVVGPEKPGNQPAESATAGSPSDQGGEFAAVERQTTGVAAPTSKPADAGPAAPRTSPAADLKPPVPAAETPAPHGRTHALNVEKPADGERAAATSHEAPGATHSGKSTEKPAAAPDRRRARSTRTYAPREPRLARTHGDRRDGAREFVDAYGVRHIILPRRWSERAYDVPAMARPSRATRVIVVRPAPFDDD